MEGKRKYDLEERLIDFAVLIIKVSENLYKTNAGIYVGGQIVRSVTSPALHYGEAQSAESRADFIHKIKVILKELRETKNALRIVKKVPLTESINVVDDATRECNELISIFVKSVETAKKNLLNEKQRISDKKQTVDNE